MISTIKWYHYIFLWFLPARRSVDINKETGAITTVYYKVMNGNIFIVKEKFVEAPNGRDPDDHSSV